MGELNQRVLMAAQNPHDTSHGGLAPPHQKRLLKVVRRGAARALYPFYLHPLIAFGGIWLLIWLLYSLHLSQLILYPGSNVLSFDGVLVTTFVAGGALAYLLPPRFRMPARWRLPNDTRTLELLDRRLKLWFRIWCGITVLEVIYSGGIPMLWLLTGNSKTYMDFGIPTIHGFMNSMLLAICLVRLSMALRYGRKEDLLLPAWAIFWSIIVITRQLMMVFLLEAAVAYCTYRRIQTRRALNAGLSLLGLVYIFGVLGDLRSGAEGFRALAQPTSTYPDWLPSGFLWFYMYLSTPINNLLYTFHTTQPLYDWQFPNTLSQLLPTVLRNVFFTADQLGTVNGDLVTSAFNVSTAFAGPFQDFGIAGVVLFVFFISLLSCLYWQKRTFRDRLCYAVLCQCLLLTVFYNHFVLLPVITQLIWIYIFFYRTEGDVLVSDPARHRTARPHAA
jgi:oligosaccharide repeat unit polymerase